MTVTLHFTYEAGFWLLLFVLACWVWWEATDELGNGPEYTARENWCGALGLIAMLVAVWSMLHLVGAWF